MKLPFHRQFRFGLLLHRPLQLTRTHALYGDCLNFPPNAFFFEKAVERRTAVIESFVGLRFLHWLSPLSCLLLFLRANSKSFSGVFLPPKALRHIPKRAEVINTYKNDPRCYGS